eukprot:IDg15151t1
MMCVNRAEAARAHKTLTFAVWNVVVLRGDEECRQPKIDQNHHRLARVQFEGNIARLDVAMDDASRVHELQASQQLHAIVEHFFNGQPDAQRSLFSSTTSQASFPSCPSPSSCRPGRGDDLLLDLESDSGARLAVTRREHLTVRAGPDELTDPKAVGDDIAAAQLRHGHKQLPQGCAARTWLDARRGRVALFAMRIVLKWTSLALRVAWMQLEMYWLVSHITAYTGELTHRVGGGVLLCRENRTRSLNGWRIVTKLSTI